MLRRLNEKASPAMIVAIVAVVFTMTGSAFAARSLLTGADIKDGTITRADLAPGAVSAAKAKAKRGRRGVQGPKGPQGEQGPEGPIGPQGERGATGATGAQGPAGPFGTTGAKGATGQQGLQGDPGPQGEPGPQGSSGQTLLNDVTTPGGPIDAGTPLAIGSGGPSIGEGVDLIDGLPLAAGTYRVEVTVRFSDGTPPEAALEYGVARLFLSGSPLDGTTPDPNGGSTSFDATLETGDVPDDGSNRTEASAAFIVSVGDDTSGGETLTLRGAIRGDEAGGGLATAHVIVSSIS